VRSRSYGFSLAALLSWLAPVAVVVALWYPHLAHYYVSTPRVTPDAVEAARQTPDDAVLRELAGFTPGFMLARAAFDVRDPVPAANRLLEGVVEIPSLPRRSIAIPFATRDVVEGPTDWQLAAAALSLPALLVRAYQKTGEDRYLLAARDMLLGWASFERSAWLPRGFLWNDHAVAARISVLGQFWLAYRRHPSYDPAVAARILQFTARSAAFLADPSHFTVSSNHGVMQNLGLWHYSLAFPTLPDGERFRRLARERLGEQLGFYVTDEGVILEHSFGYQRDGLELLGMALRYRTLMADPAPPDWVAKYRRAVDFYAQLRLPNGELPAIGDTPVEPDVAGPRITGVSADGRAEPLASPSAWPSPAPSTVDPVAGYALWWSPPGHGAASELPSRTAVAWSYFPGHAHKHADEMSWVLWAGGRTWLTSVGYWQNEAPGQLQATSWAGSNAPHLVAEPTRSVRSTRLLSATRSDRMAMVDLERTGPGGYAARRQILHVKPDLWIVVDHVSGQPGGVNQVQWATGKDIDLRSIGAAGLYRLQPAAGSLSMILGLASSPTPTIRRLRGSLDPFGGWQVMGPWIPVPVDALVLEQPSDDSWSITTWCLQDESKTPASCPARPISARYTRADDWSVTVPRLPASITLNRKGDVLTGDLPTSSGGYRLALEPPPDVASRRAAIRTAYEQAASHYPRFRDLGAYRLRAIYAVCFAMVLQGLVLGLVVPPGNPRRVLRWLSVVAWLALGLWLTRVYLS
jgi:hypothetical protein